VTYFWVCVKKKVAEMKKSVRSKSIRHVVALVDIPYGKFPTYGFSLRKTSTYFAIYNLVFLS